MVALEVNTTQLKQLISLLDVELRRTGLTSLGQIVGLHNLLIPALAVAESEEKDNEVTEINEVIANS